MPAPHNRMLSAEVTTWLAGDRKGDVPKPLVEALVRHGGNLEAVARDLQVGRRTLSRWVASSLSLQKLLAELRTNAELKLKGRD